MPAVGWWSRIYVWLCHVTASYFGTCRKMSIAPRNTLEERIQVGAVKCEQRC
jgi:hypothetical protein